MMIGAMPNAKVRHRKKKLKFLGDKTVVLLVMNFLYMRRYVGILAGVMVMMVLLFACGSKNRRNKVLVRPNTQVTGVAEEQPETEGPKEATVVKTDRAAEVVKETKVAEKPVPQPIRVQLPAVNREFRAAWIATVANINWPSKNNLSTEEQKREAISLLNLLQSNNFNAVIFQVRPSADALYNSNLEPWSYFLTGETGRKPYPYYDPLEFWVEEAHKRGMELHVWLNPYRAHHSSGGSVGSASSVRKFPDNTVRLKNGTYWFDPADQTTQDHASAVVRDIVKRYDIDGVHFDDYFYPYATYNGGADFPDNRTWNAYRQSGGNLSRADWRRDHVNRFIKRVYGEIKAEKKHVKFGLSPFGIWKPGYPAGITGSSQYDELYADAKLWLNEGWVDYFAPQLYWAIDPPRQSFPALLRWWQSENRHNRHLWPGLNTVEVRTADRPTEIVRQVELAREILPNSQGVIHWSIAGLTKSPAMVSALANGPYKEKALVPASPWLQTEQLETPTLLLTKEKSGSIFSKWQHRAPEKVNHWVVFAQYGNRWEYKIYDQDITSFEFSPKKDGQALKVIAVQAIDRIGNGSDYVAYDVK